jgi:hypothetical protein
LENLYAEVAPRFERKPSQLRRLFDGCHKRAARADNELGGPNDPWSFALYKLAVDHDSTRPVDLAPRQHSGLSHDKLSAISQGNGAVFKKAFDLDGGPGVKLQVRVAQHIAAAEVALVSRYRRRLSRQ